MMAMVMAMVMEVGVMVVAEISDPKTRSIWDFVILVVAIVVMVGGLMFWDWRARKRRSEWDGIDNHHRAMDELNPGRAEPRRSVREQHQTRER